MTSPIGVLAYCDHLATLLGETVTDEGTSPIVVAVDLLFRLAILRQCDSVAFLAQQDGSLAIRLRCDGVWSALPDLTCGGSMISRLFVLGGLEKGEEARGRSQRSSAVVQGTRMIFETEPLGHWKENLRIRVLTGMFACSGCLGEHPSGHIHVVPSWDRESMTFLTSYRCDLCWQAALRETRRQIDVPGELAWEKLCDFLARHGCAEEVISTLPAPLASSMRGIEQVLDGIASERLVIDPR